MNKRLIAFLSILSLSISLPIIPVNAAVKSGGACTKAGVKSIASGKTFTCIKAKNKLVWDKGVKAVVAVDLLTDCRLPVADGRGDVSIGGWPRIDERLKSTGDVIATVVMVDFPDAPATMTPTDAFARISQSADVFKEMSYGKFNYTFKPQ